MTILKVTTTFMALFLVSQRQNQHKSSGSSQLFQMKMYICNRFGQYDLKLKINNNQNYVKNWEITKALTPTLACD